MLHRISWGDFSIFILVLTGIYYLYIITRFYRVEVLGFFVRKGQRSGGAANGRPDILKDGKRGQEGQTAGNQPELFQDEARTEQGDVLFKVMEQAIGQLKEVIKQGALNKLDRENLLDHIREVLGNYRQLQGTAYDQAINNFLMRVCTSEFSVILDEREVVELWK
jgi:hypothetical protein